MKNAELIALLIANTNKTRNLRTYGRKWFSGARRVCDKVASEVGKMVALVQDRIDEGHIIDGTCQSLLIYNFQPLQMHTEATYITFDMVVKPIEQIHDTHTLVGEPVQLVVDIITCEVMNNAQALLSMGLYDSAEISNPMFYGNYKDYRAVASFVAIRHSEHIGHDEVFAGMYDKLPIMQDSVAFNSFVEARNYLEEHWEEYCRIAEMNYPKEEHEEVKASGVIGAHIIKLIHPHRPEVVVSDKLTTEPKEDRVDDEVERILEAQGEAPAESDFGMTVAR